MYNDKLSALEALKAGFDKWLDNCSYSLAFLGLLELACLTAAGTMTVQLVLIAQLLFQLQGVPPDSYIYAFLVIYIVLRSIFQLSINRWLLRMWDGERMTLNVLLGYDYAQNLSQVVKLMAASLLFNCYMVGGSVLLVPGLIASGTLRFYKFVLVDKPCTAAESLRDSYDLTTDNQLQLVYLTVLTAFIKLGGLCLLGVGVIPARAVCGLAEAYAYKKLLRLHSR